MKFNFERKMRPVAPALESEESAPISAPIESGVQEVVKSPQPIRIAGEIRAVSKVPSEEEMRHPPYAPSVHADEAA